ncbi:hypothetical protein E2562_032352 [Oryza meyeriana var. granulata]|uniref:DUF834 domain-containing protein n=1 Tax=Oryza meyeriana var. granulata TaxID=110450 RepID=A0A6G1CAJ8_9ORYZ|nr:hypothetical protein E2562_032352 [Oryza meyeriana var. granulata]
MGQRQGTAMGSGGALDNKAPGSSGGDVGRQATVARGLGGEVLGNGNEERRSWRPVVLLELLDLVAAMLGGGRLQWRRATTTMRVTEGCVGRWLWCSGAPDPEVATYRDDGGRRRP